MSSLSDILLMFLFGGFFFFLNMICAPLPHVISGPPSNIPILSAKRMGKKNPEPPPFETRKCSSIFMPVIFDQEINGFPVPSWDQPWQGTLILAAIANSGNPGRACLIEKSATCISMPQTFNMVFMF